MVNEKAGDNDDDMSHVGLGINAEIVVTDPVGLQYFKDVDFMVSGLDPDNRGYFDINIFNLEGDFDSVSILRHQVLKPDDSVNKGDDINLKGQKFHLELNAKSDSKGEYLEYPNDLSESGNKILTAVMKALAKLVSVDGSLIMINGTKRYESIDNTWVPLERAVSQRPPRLDEPKKQLQS